MKGRIIKGIAGFYYVYLDELGVVECKAKGIFRNEGLKPLVGDIAEVDILSKVELTGNITDIYDRNNELIRPRVANVDQALIIFALKKPDPNFVTLDKMIIQYEAVNVPVKICFNKCDLSDSDEILNHYSRSGCELFVTSVKDDVGINELINALKGKLTVVCGPSGVGKSSIINALIKDKVSETGEISAKLKRGKHTTRHSEIFPIDRDTFIMDTPGFGSFELFDVDKENLSSYYREFDKAASCRFLPCSHTHEPDCAVKAMVDSGDISRLRYESYLHIYNELLNKRRY